VAHVSPDSRALLVRSLRKLQYHGRLTGRDVRWAARALQVSERTVWLWLNTEPADPAGRAGPRPYLLTEADRDALADWCGSAAAAWRAQQAAGVPLPALRTFQQAVRRQLSAAERAALADWELARVERALRTLDRRLATTGLRLSGDGWDSYRLTARPGILGSKAAEQLRLAHGGRTPLEAWAAALLSHIITGAATSGLSQDVVPEPYRSTGIDVLLDRGLITSTAHGYRPSDEVIFGLWLDPWQY